MSHRSRRRVLFAMGMLLSSVASAASWNPAGSMTTARGGHTATLLNNGKVLAAGGNGVSSVELYDPATNSWSPAAALPGVRGYHTATLLLDGRVLVVGGHDGTATLDSAVLYDPAQNTWTATPAPGLARRFHTATLLNDGKVLVAGGDNGTTPHSAVQIFDPSTNTWSAAAAMITPRRNHAAALLADGRVLVIGGFSTLRLILCEIYDPGSGTWSATGNLGHRREFHTATRLPTGNVLAAGGHDGYTPLMLCEIYDAASGTWTATGDMSPARQEHTATLLPDGRVLVAGAGVVATQTFAAGLGSWSNVPNAGTARLDATATLLPNGKVLLCGGNGLSSCELFGPASEGIWSGASPFDSARERHCSTMLPDGRILVAGGNGLQSAETYNFPANDWTTVAPMSVIRVDFTLTLLTNGRVLAVGGYDGDGTLSSAETYNPATNTWSAVASMNAARQHHTATLLPDGKVLVVDGSSDGSNALASAEIYDPAANTWAPAASMDLARVEHTATLMVDGRVLVAGGRNVGTATATAEIYVPGADNWTNPPDMTAARSAHTATLLPDGRVMVAGGSGTAGPIGGVEAFNPVNNTWSALAALSVARFHHSALLLQDGRLLVAGGQGAAGVVNSTEFYIPAGNFWTTTGTLITGRTEFEMSLLPNGEVLASGGLNSALAGLASSEKFAFTPVVLPAWRPGLDAPAASLPAGNKLALTGTKFRGHSESSSGGTNSSATDHPVVQIRRLDNSQVRFLALDNATPWSVTAFTSSRVNGFPVGHALITVFVNGIPSLSRTIVVTKGAVALEVSGHPSPSTAGVQGSFQVRAVDEFGTTVTAYLGTVAFDSSDDGASTVLPSNYTFLAGDNGLKGFQATLTTAGTQGLVANDTANSLTGDQEVGVTHAAADHFVVSGFPDPVITGTSGNFTVTVKDAYDNTVDDYTGTVGFTSSDGAASLPGSYAFLDSDDGTKQFSATLNTIGSQSITATQTMGPTGSQTGIDVIPVTPPPSIVAAFSRRKHGGRTTFDIPLDMGAAGAAATVEPRRGGPTQIVFEFDQPVRSVGALGAGHFTITNGAFVKASFGYNGTKLTLDLKPDGDQLVVFVALSASAFVGRTDGQSLVGDTDVNIRALLGDVNGDGIVNAADVAPINANLRKFPTAATFRADLNCDRVIHTDDRKLATNALGHALP